MRIEIRCEKHGGCEVLVDGADKQFNDAILKWQESRDET